MSEINLNSIKVSIKPFDIDGNYTDYIDVTKYVSKLGSLTLDIDSSDYQLGVYRNSSVSITLANRDGLFSDVDVIQSIFKYKRSDSLVKIEYSLMEEGPLCGIAEVGNSYLSDTVELFSGLLSDESYKFDVKNDEATFKILGKESLFDREIVPFSSLSVGDSIEEIIYACLNQSTITNILTVSESNITVDLDQDSDVIDWLENKTVREALDKLLLVSNSVLYIKDDVVYVTNRDATVSNQYTFYGQASQLGPENLIELKNLSNGLHRVFNFVTWKDTTFFSQDIDSISLLGIKKLEVDFEIFTAQAKQEALMDNLVSEFKDKKIELDITVPMNYDTIALDILDRINIDYPTVYYKGDFDLPICGIAVCGDEESATLPKGQWALTLQTDKYFKILKKVYDVDKLEIGFKLREI